MQEQARICDVADELNADVFVIGTRRMNLKEGTESSATRVIKRASCPLLVVP